MYILDLRLFLLIRIDRIYLFKNQVLDNLNIHNNKFIRLIIIWDHLLSILREELRFIRLNRFLNLDLKLLFILHQLEQQYSQLLYSIILQSSRFHCLRTSRFVSRRSHRQTWRHLVHHSLRHIIHHNQRQVNWRRYSYLLVLW